MPKIHLKSKEAAALWKHEIQGQLSDGAWENSKPRDHWHFWSRCEPVVDGKVGFSGGYPVRRNYDLSVLTKNEIVRDRMIAMINAVKNGKNPMLAEYLVNDRWLELIKSRKDKYWADKGDAIIKEYGDDLDKARELVTGPYKLSDLKKFLAEIKEAMSTSLGVNESKNVKSFRQFLNESKSKNIK